MKRLVSVILIFSLALLCSSAICETDLSSMSFDDLVALREQLNLTIWNSKEWQKVDVPAGTYQIGVDIPAGHWTIIPYPDTLSNVYYFDRIDKYGKDPASGWEGWSDLIADSSKYSDWEKYPHQCDAVLEEGMYIKLTGRVYFTPYTGKPDFGFN